MICAIPLPLLARQVGFSLPIIGALLGHTQAQTTARYSHFIGQPLREAAGLIGGKIDNALKGKY